MFLNTVPQKVFRNKPGNPYHKLIDFNVASNLNGGHLSLFMIIMLLIKILVVEPCLAKEDEKN
jgi:hypothetical protein